MKNAPPHNLQGAILNSQASAHSAVIAVNAQDPMDVFWLLVVLRMTISE